MKHNEEEPKHNDAAAAPAPAPCEENKDQPTEADKLNLVSATIDWLFNFKAMIFVLIEAFTDKFVNLNCAERLVEGDIPCWNGGFLNFRFLYFILLDDDTCPVFFFFLRPLSCLIALQWDQLDSVSRFKWDFSNLEVSIGYVLLDFH